MEQFSGEPNYCAGPMHENAHANKAAIRKQFVNNLRMKFAYASNSPITYTF